MHDQFDSDLDQMDDQEVLIEESIVKRDLPLELERFNDARLKTMTAEELQAHIRILYGRMDSFLEHFGRLHKRVWAAKGYDPSKHSTRLQHGG